MIHFISFLCNSFFRSIWWGVDGLETTLRLTVVPSITPLPALENDGNFISTLISCQTPSSRDAGRL